MPYDFSRASQRASSIKTRIKTLINSIIKNRVNKQEIAGGPIVQVTSFGTSKGLNIRYKDKNGNLLLTKEEYERKIQSGEIQAGVFTGNPRILWGGRNEGTGERLSDKEALEVQSQSQRGSRDGHSVEEVSKQIDRLLKDNGIRATKQKVRRATSQEFHDAIAQEKLQNPNGWMVDVHDVKDYDNDLCMLTEDGKAGIAVTKDGDIISVFSSVKGDHRLDKLMQMAIAAGGKKLDCYYQEIDGKLTGLPEIYARFGFKVDAVTSFAEEYAPDDYKAWKEKNPGITMKGVAAMSLKVENSISSYSLESSSGVKDAKEFSGENGYDEMLSYRDKNIPAFETKTSDKPQSYEEYCKENQGDLAYYDVYAPIWTKELLHKFADLREHLPLKQGLRQ